MALDAERVIVEIEAQTGGFETNITRAGATHNRVMSDVEKSAGRTEVAIRTSSERAAQAVTSNTGRMRAGYVQLGAQAQDIVVQLQGGASIATVMTQQSGQVIQAIQLMQGSAGGFLGFLGGPWGAVIVAASSVVGLLIGKLIEGGDAADSETRKLAENEAKTRAAAEAKQAFEQTAQGVIAALRRETEELEKQNRTLDENVRLQQDRFRSLQGAAGIQLLQSTSQLAAATQELAQAQADVDRARGIGGAGGSQVQAAAQRRLTAAQEEYRRLTTQIAELQASIAAADRAARQAERPLAEREARERADPIEAIQGRFRAEAEAALRARAENRLTYEQLRDQLADIERRKNAAVRAEQERQARLRREQNQTGRDLIRPAAGSVISQFGADRSGVPLNGRRVPGRRHEGVDIAGRVGDPVLAPFSGQVEIRDNPGGLGLNVVVTSGNRRAILAHLSGTSVSPGQRVEQGQRVGSIGTSGNAAGGVPHLHYQLQVGGRNVNPMRYTGSSGAASQAQAAEREQAREQARLAELWLRNQDQMVQELSRADGQLLQARQRNAETAEQRAALEIQQIEEEYHRAEADAYADAQRRTREDPLHAIAYNLQAAFLSVKARQLADERAAQVQRAEALRREREGTERTLDDLNLQEEILRLRQGLAVTEGERRDIALRLLDYAEQEERVQLESLIRQKELAGIQDNELRAARARLAVLPQLYGLQRDAINRQHENPHQRYLRGLNEGLGDVDTQLQELDVRAMRALEDSIVDATKSALGLKGALGDIVGELIRIGLQRAIIQPLADMLFGGGSGGKGGGGIFGAILGAVGLFDPGGTGGRVFNMGGGTFNKFASGGSMTIGGRGGIDQNTLSLNGEPIAHVSRGERLDVVPQGRTPSAVPSLSGPPGGGAGGVALIRLELSDDIDARIVSVSGPVAVETVRAATPGIVRVAGAATLRRVSRPGING